MKTKRVEYKARVIDADTLRDKILGGGGAWTKDKENMLIDGELLVEYIDEYAFPATVVVEVPDE